MNTRFLSMLTIGIICLGCTKKPEAKAISEPKENSAHTGQTIPKISLDGLNQSQKDFFIKFTNDEICPCGCPKTFAGCLQKTTQCKPAWLLAEWMIDSLKAGFPTTGLAEVTSKEIAGFSAASKDIATTNFASMGSSSAPVQIIEFADYQCGHCKNATENLKVFFIKHRDNLKMTYKHYPLPGHKMAEDAAIAAEAAGKQGKFWEMSRTLFATQNFLDTKLIQGHAKALGLNIEQFKKDIASDELKSRVQASKLEAQKLGLSGTPSFFFNGRPYNLSYDPAHFELRYQMELARAQSGCE